MRRRADDRRAISFKPVRQADGIYDVTALPSAENGHPHFAVYWEFKAEFCALLAWALGNATTPANITAKLYRSKAVEFIDDQPQPAKPNPAWPPPIPEKFVANEEAQELFGETTEIDLPSYDIADDAITFHPKTICGPAEGAHFL